MAGTLTVRIIESPGEVRDRRFAFRWSAWLEGRLLEEGFACDPDSAESQALSLVEPGDTERVEVEIDWLIDQAMHRQGLLAS